MKRFIYEITGLEFPLRFIFFSPWRRGKVRGFSQFYTCNGGGSMTRAERSRVREVIQERRIETRVFSWFIA
jgi:hypothetical protein